MFKEPLQKAKSLGARLYYHSMKRIEIHLTEEETFILDQIAVEDGRSRKNLCETEIRKLINKSQNNNIL